MTSEKTKAGLNRQAQDAAHEKIETLYPDDAETFYTGQKNKVKSPSLAKTAGQTVIMAPVIAARPAIQSTTQSTTTAPETLPGAVVQPDIVPARTSETVTLADPCDKARLEVVHAILKESKNSGILSKMVKLASLKMAYLLASDPNGKRTLEDYANKLDIKKDDALSANITDLYKTYGAATDQRALEVLSNGKKYNYYNKSVRLTNDNASAMVLYLANSNTKKDPMSLTTEDAAVIWAQQKVFESKKMVLGDSEGNLLNFSTQVYHLLNLGNAAGTSAAQLKTHYDKDSEELQKTILAAVNGLNTDEKQCFKDVAGGPCDHRPVSLGSESVLEIQSILAKLVSTGSVGTGDIQLNLDLENGVKAKDGIITIATK